MSKFDQKIPKGSVPNCQSKFAIHDPIRWFKCKIKPPKHKTGKDLINYLDDYFFVALLCILCNAQVSEFINICDQIRFAISLEKTFWATTQLTFLGLLIDSVKQIICVPKKKINKTLLLITSILDKSSRKIMMNQLQKICGFLNFLGRAVIPGRAFMRRLYAHTANPKLKLYHHIRITSEMRSDIVMWKQFLSHQTAYARPFMDFTKLWMASEVDVFSDASKNTDLGMGGVNE